MSRTAFSLAPIVANADCMEPMEPASKYLSEPDAQFARMLLIVGSVTWKAIVYMTMPVALMLAQVCAVIWFAAVTSVPS